MPGIGGGTGGGVPRDGIWVGGDWKPWPIIGIDDGGAAVGAAIGGCPG